MTQPPGFNSAKRRAVDNTLQKRYRQPLGAGTKPADRLIASLRGETGLALQNKPVRAFNP
ncbi:hypothetical protein [Thiohalophilus thiocyanatoxydans]|uniref:Uncharacterized protein n=1 Tax=Thiohalophilus thiocyanatoxydans TaxID=381308 RepID=A0A4R8J126_9GAMM|nr:hypothetical protein [Thiohalophilus thiocyanatoxydans]TDY03879.1 hypothetical protein EDC23_0250 [Thiohalophilus thiocyanatoxydans]